tara:strand:+ start:2005 stop:6927 length:4923 start_codon:yes stop_codon:yes gene_type:complete
MSENRGIFSLEEFYDLQVSGETTNIFQVFRYVDEVITATPAFGYLAGGKSSGGDRTSVDRIDYGNDTATASPKGNLDNGGNVAGTGNQSFGYTAGYYWSTCNRIDYSSDTATAVQKGTLSSARTYISAVGNRNFGYWCGGTLNQKTNIDRLDYSNDTAATTPKGPLSIPTLASAATGNSDFGYIGGLRPSESRTLRIDYSNDSALTVEKGALIAGGYMLSAAGNSDFGYWNGGSHGSRVGRLDYANDSVNAVFRGNTTFTGVKRAGTGSGSFGYFTGGDPSPQTTIIDRIDYSNDTSIAAKGNLSLGKYYHAGVSAQENGLATVPIPATRTESGVTPVPNFGYFAGGMWPVVSTIDRIDYANDTATAAVKGPLDRDLLAQQSTSNSTHGYFAGGEPSGTSKVSRMEFSNDTATTSPKGPLSAVQKYFGAAGNLSFGYYAGNAPSTVSTVSRIDYSNDTATALAKGPLSFAKGNAQGCGNLSFGYFAGGNGNKSSVDRIDYSNDTATASAKGPLENSRSTYAASGTSDFGYWSGGYPYYTKASRIDYSNDTATAVAKAPYPSTVTPYGFSNAAGTGNSTHGYAAGGNGYNSYMWRIDYANDTANGVQKGPLSQGRLRFSGVSPLENGLPSKGPGPVDKGAAGYTNTTSGPAYGYFAGSYNNTSSVDRVDYNNDTATASPKGNLPSDASQGGGAGNRSYGYTFTGWAPGIATTVYRVDYANDTAAAATKGPVSKAGNYARSVGNANYGYTGGRGGGGVGPTDISLMDRVDYANDTATATVVNATGMDPGARIVAAVGNQSYGYFAGGTPGTSVVRRLDYSSDTTATSPKGPLSAARSYCSPGTGNADYGYVLGRNPSQGPSTDVERIDYSNDTATALMRGKLSLNPSNAYAVSQSGVSNPTYAYFGGGDPASTHVDRIEFSNDTPTASPKGNLATARKSPYSFSAQNSGLPSATYIPRIRWVDSAPESSPSPGPDISPSAGYIMGGNGAGSPSYNAPAQKIDFSNDTATAVVKGAPSSSGNDAYYSTAVGNRDYGYMTGGRTFEEVHRLDYSNDTAQMLEKSRREPNSALGYEECATGNLNYAYFNGGYANYSFPGPAAGCPGTYAPNLSHIYRLEYANDTTNAILRSYNSVAAGRKGACGNNDYGYWIGGATLCSSGTGSSTYVERTDYASDTTNSVAKGNTTVNLESSRGQGSKDFGYSMGMSYGRSFVQRIDYANDTNTATPKGNLAYNFKKHGSTGNQSFGYAAGGSDGPGYGVSIVNRVDYSNDTATASPKGPLANAVQEMGGCSASENQIFATGPEIPGLQAPVQPPFPFPVQLPDPRGPAYGYFSGGFNPSNSPAHPSWVVYSNVDRIDFASDTSTASPKGKLDQARYSAAGAGSSSHGYIGASSLSSGYTSIVARVDYANDSATAVVKGSMTPGTDRYQAATSNTSYGWFSGGQPGGSNSKVQRIDFSNDDTTASPRGNLSLSRQALAGAGNASYGWHAGGYNWPAPDYIRTIVDRIDYANDSSTATPKGPLSVKRRGLGATGNADYGYYSGGYNVVPGGNNWVTNIDRIDYSNDTPTASPKGNLSQTRSRLSATGNTSYGYVVGGEGNNDNGLSTVDRIDFASDTSTAATKGPLSYTARGLSGFSAQANALPQ